MELQRRVDKNVNVCKKWEEVQKTENKEYGKGDKTVENECHRNYR